MNAAAGQIFDECALYAFSYLLIFSQNAEENNEREREPHREMLRVRLKVHEPLTRIYFWHVAARNLLLTSAFSRC